MKRNRITYLNHASYFEVNRGDEIPGEASDKRYLNLFYIVTGVRP